MREEWIYTIYQAKSNRIHGMKHLCNECSTELIVGLSSSEWVSPILKDNHWPNFSGVTELGQIVHFLAPFTCRVPD